MSSDPVVPGGGEFGGAGASSSWHEEPFTFANLRVIQEWESGLLSNMTRLILMDAAFFSSDTLGWILHLTSIWRSKAEDEEIGGTGVHCAWRAVDVRTKDRPRSDVDRLTAYLNGRYVYDPRRPDKPVAYSADHGTGPHLRRRRGSSATDRTDSRRWVYAILYTRLPSTSTESFAV